MITRPPLLLSDTSVWLATCDINHCRCMEAIHHLVRDGSRLRDKIINYICSPESICAHVKLGQGFILLRNVCKCEEVVKVVKVYDPTNNHLYERFDHYVRWIHGDISQMAQAKDPSLVVTATATSQPTTSQVRMDLENVLKFKTLSSVKIGSLKPDEAWWRSRQLGGFNKFSHLWAKYSGHTSYVSSVCVTTDGKIISGSYDKAVRVWDVSTGTCERTLEGHTSWVPSACVTTDGKIISGSWDNTVRVWDISTGTCERTLEGHTDTVSSVCAIPDGKVISGGSDDKTVRVWDVSTAVIRYTAAIVS